jgi:rhodanese-related sulfurtransferase
MLAGVGLFGVRGIVTSEPQAWRKAGLPGRTGEQIDPVAAARAFQSGEVTLLDVRDPSEWERLTIPGVARSALWQLGRWGAPSAAPVAVVCASGARAAIAASALRTRLPQPVLRVDGAIADLQAALIREPAAL